jgi:hypothetical protein
MHKYLHANIDPDLTGLFTTTIDHTEHTHRTDPLDRH